METTNARPMMEMSHVKVYALVAVAAITLMLLMKTMKVLFNPLRSIPGPLSTRLTSMKFQYASVKGRQCHWVHQMHQRYGPVVRVAPNRVSVADLATVKTIYNLKEPYYKTEWYPNFSGRGKPSVFATRDPHGHQQSRKLLGNAMTETSLIKNFEGMMKEETTLWQQKIEADLKDPQGYTDLFAWNVSLAADMISIATFGSSFDLLSHGVKANSEYWENVVKSPPYRYMCGLFPILHTLNMWAPFGPLHTMRVIDKRRVQYAKDSLKRHRDSEKLKSDDTKPTLFSKVYEANGKDAHKPEGFMDDEQITREAMSYLTAGTDTTAVTLTNLLWEMGKHPELEAALSKEMNSLPDDYTSGDLRDAKYLNQVLQENLRLHPAAGSGLPRYVPAGGLHTCDRLYIPAGSQVSIQAYTLHRDPTAFPDPDRFDPSRWEQPTQAMKDRMVAFGGGTRTCLGKNFTMLEQRHAIATLYRALPSGLQPAYGALGHDDVEAGRSGMCDDDMGTQDHFVLRPKGERCYMKLRS